MNRRFSMLMVFVLVAALLLPATVSAQVIVTDGPAQTSAAYSHRLIVELTSPPLAQASTVQAAAAGGGKLNVNSPAAQTYIQRLQAEQQAFVSTMQAAIPNARVATYRNERGAAVPATYQILLNGMVVDAGRNVDVDALQRQLSQLPNVKRVTKDYAQNPDLYASLPLINAEAAWNDPAIGGKANAGEGIKFASMDGGVHKDSPMFDGAGYTYPPGFPKGDTSATNGKIILARAYFRTWDPPSPGDENAWPGTLGTSHGNHTASITAGNEVQASYLGAPPITISGVAPKSYIMSYRVFYNSITNDGSFYNTEGIKALEDIVADGADVLNNSWGGGPGSIGGPYDALDTALRNAVAAGIFVAMSAGNAGPGASTTDHPSSDYISVAASTTDGTYASGRIDATAPEPVPAELTQISYSAASFGGDIPLATILGPYPFATAASVDAGNANGCAAFPADAFAGKVAMISRGGCEFGVKALNGQNAGATMFIVYNNAGDGLINMGPGAVGGSVTIPGVFIGQTAGTALAAWYAANPATAELQLSTVAFQVGNDPDVIINFSSRGPGVGNVLKPDIAAPGVNILAQGFAPGETGEDRHHGFGQASGTSMAAPHVAGAGILLKQIHPTWSPAYIKSALMSTSKYLDIFTESGATAQPLDMGAGRLDLTNAADPGVILDPPSLSFGRVTQGDAMTMTVMLTSVADAEETYTVSTLDTRGGFAATTALDGVTVSPTSITLAPGASANLTVSWDTAETSGPGDQQGFVVLDGSTHDAHFPLWVRVGYPDDPNVGRVLVIDNDGSSSLGAPDYTGYYTETLTTLGITYDVWDADGYAGNSVTLPDANYLTQYDAVIYQTGDNWQANGTFTVPTPPTDLDMDALTEYANNGGAILAFGQDFSALSGGASTSPPFLYGAILGARFLQDSINAEEVFTDTAQLLNGLPQGPFGDMSFDISGRGDGAGNQGYVDEIGASCTDPDFTLCGVTPFLQYGIRGNDVENGYVALGTRDAVSLERPGVSSYATAAFFSFGLEGVNNDTNFNTREDLLGTALQWAWDEPVATIEIGGETTPGRVTLFTATVESAFGGDGVTYRWDFGDGTPFTNAYSSATAGHTYAKPGRYTVRVEVTNELGNRVIGETVVQIGLPVFLPLIAR